MSDIVYKVVCNVNNTHWSVSQVIRYYIFIRLISQGQLVLPYSIQFWPGGLPGLCKSLIWNINLPEFQKVAISEDCEGPAMIGLTAD